jgi:uncharacterized ferritin-like protein (DUF455 family)
VLQTADPKAKVRLTAAAARAWRSREIDLGEASPPPRRPARPERPVLLPPSEMPRRGVGAGGRGRVALLHALAHIELNAIDLAWDMVARFGGTLEDEAWAREFHADWLRVAEDEACHFALLAGRLGELGAAYGDLPAHDGLWEAAEDTRHDLLARLAVVPLVLEARGLDVTPTMRKRLARAGDQQSAEILDRIYADEIGHVAAGRRWFERICAARSLAPESTYHALVRRHFGAPLKPPFNDAARAQAGFSSAFYLPLAGSGQVDKGAKSG